MMKVSVGGCVLEAVLKMSVEGCVLNMSVEGCVLEAVFIMKMSVVNLKAVC